MKYYEILGASLKDDFLLDLFETYDVDVVYSYDRNHDGIDDQYFATIPEMGLEFIFSTDQILETLFLKKTIHNGFNPFSSEDPRDVPFDSLTEAVAWGNEKAIDLVHKSLSSGNASGGIPEWVKFEFKEYFVHYQFEAGGIDMVTLMAKNA